MVVNNKKIYKLTIFLLLDCIINKYEQGGMFKMKDKSVVYEYTSINVRNELEPMYVDCYEHFGWIHIKNEEKKDYYINNDVNLDIVTIKFKRDRAIPNKDELNELQKKCEKAFLKINKLEKEPMAWAISYALIIGLIGVLFGVVSVFSILASNWFIGTISAVVAVIGFIFPYFVYIRVKGNKIAENKSKIALEQDLIFAIFEQAKKILFENE